MEQPVLVDCIPKITTLRRAIQLARELDVSVRQPRRTGELLFEHPVVGRVRVNARRHDASRELMHLLRRAAETRSSPPAINRSIRTG